jgi:hypothetical protein
MAKPISLAQEVRASPTNPADINTSLRRPQAPRAAPMAPPRTVNRGTFQRAPVAAILQGGGMNGFGAAPIPLPAPARASLMDPNMVNQSLRRPQAARGAPMAPPREVNRGTFQRVPVQAILQGGGMNGAPLQVSNINGAPLIVAPIQSGGGLGAMNSDMSVSAQQRAAKAIKAGGPIVGDYTDAIRSSAGFAFGPKRMPGQGFAAASYSYPAQQMVIGATLAGVPILAPPPMPPMPNMAAPRLGTRGGGTIRGQISSSPSEDRRKLMSTLMGLGAVPDYTVLNADGVKPFERNKDSDEEGLTRARAWFSYFLEDLPNVLPAFQAEARDFIATLDWSNRYEFVKNNFLKNAGKTASLPLVGNVTWLRETMIKWLYLKLWGTPIAATKLQKAMALPFVSAPNIAAALTSPEYDPAYKDQVGGDSGGGGATDPNLVRVPVGPSATNAKTISVPSNVVCPVVVNRSNGLRDGGFDNPAYGDSFAVSQSGTTATITRTDAPGSGWGMNLVLPCKAAQGGGGGGSTQPPGTTGIIQQPPLRVFLPGGGSSTPPPSKKKDNTMLIVGGVAALAALGAVAYVATKK